jgi:hypothetical protein
MADVIQKLASYLRIEDRKAEGGAAVSGSFGIAYGTWIFPVSVSEQVVALYAPSGPS